MMIELYVQYRGNDSYTGGLRPSCVTFFIVAYGQVCAGDGLGVGCLTPKSFCEYSCMQPGGYGSILEMHDPAFNLQLTNTPSLD